MVMQANAHAHAFRNPTPYRRVSEKRLVPCERQELQLGAARIERVQGLGSIADHDPQSCRLVFQIANESILHQSGKLIEMDAGTWSAGAAASLDVETARGGEMLLLAFPVDHLSRSLAVRLQAGAAGTMPIRGAAQMCLELGRSCLSQADPISPVVADALGDSLVELAKLAIIEQFCTRRGETVRETVRARIRAFIHRNLADPDLTIERIADRMQCTKRYLHKVFSDEGETLNHYIWSQRLELCRNHLSRPDLAEKSITEIAFACGFSNAAHFSRSFRARFGQAPRDFRRETLEQ